MAYVNAACAGYVTTFSIGGKFRPGSNLRCYSIARSYVLLYALTANVGSILFILYSLPSVSFAVLQVCSQ